MNIQSRLTKHKIKLALEEYKDSSRQAGNKVTADSTAMFLARKFNMFSKQEGEEIAISVAMDTSELKQVCEDKERDYYNTDWMDLEDNLAEGLRGSDNFSDVIDDWLSETVGDYAAEFEDEEEENEDED